MSEKQPTFEKNLERLQRIVDQLESGELPLEKGVTLYKEGLGLTKACRKELSKARLILSKAGSDAAEALDSESGPDRGEEI